MPCDYNTYPATWEREIVPRILKRDGHQCRSCGETAGLAVHHICFEPSCEKDTDLLTLCRPCHLAADRAHHARNQRATWKRKRAQGRGWDEESVV